MTFHAMPEGSVWTLYGDLLTVPEDTKAPETMRDIHLSEEAAETMERYERPLKREAPAETRPAAPKRKLRPGMKGYTEQRREEMIRRPGTSLETETGPGEKDNPAGTERTGGETGGGNADAADSREET